MAKHKAFTFTILAMLFVLVRFSISLHQVPTNLEESSNVFPYQDTVSTGNGGRSGQSVTGGTSGQSIRASHRGPSLQDPDQGAGTLKRTIRKLLQTSNPTPPTPSTPFSPLKLTENGKTCILFWAKKLIVKLRNHTHVDLTDRAFSPNARVDLKGSSCNGEKAMLSLRFGDVADLKGLVISFLLSNTYYESTAQSWFSLDSVHILYNRSKEASFNATQIYAPAVSSYHCQHVSSLHKYDTLLEPSSHRDSLLWHITFIDFQIQAFNVEGGRFSPASDCASFFTPAILMGLLMSLILLLVLAYALHMVLHLKSIEQLDEHRPSVYLESEAESEPGDKEQAGH